VPPATTPSGEPAADAGTTTTTPGETTTTTGPDGAVEGGASTSERSGDEAEDGEQAASVLRDEQGGGSPAGSIALAGTALAAVGFFVWRARRRNHLAAAGASGFGADEGSQPLERIDQPGPGDADSPGGG
jgi:hypothetical protein